VNLGPVNPLYKWITPNPQPDGLGYNPRCIRRDISQYIASTWLKDDIIYDLLVSNTNITFFQVRLVDDPAHRNVGIHGAGHFTTGGDPGGDVSTSPGDPYFFLHRECLN
jgi:tyrosinase